MVNTSDKPKKVGKKQTSQPNKQTSKETAKQASFKIWVGCKNCVGPPCKINYLVSSHMLKYSDHLKL